eukprot:8329605-Ditylum_brightwellii.AAC.1
MYDNCFLLPWRCSLPRYAEFKWQTCVMTVSCCFGDVVYQGMLTANGKKYVITVSCCLGDVVYQ